MLAVLWRIRRFSALLLLMLLPLIALPLRAQEGAQQAVATLDDALLDVMKNAAALGAKGRFERLSPVIARVFDLPRMTQLLVGPDWQQLTDDQKQKLVDAFGHFSAANYAMQFDGYEGERFEIVGERPTPSGNVIVDTKLIPPAEPAVTLSYLMHQGQQGWQIIDVLQEGTVSELARRRSEFSSILRNDGVDALLVLLDRRSTEMVSQ